MRVTNTSIMNTYLSDVQNNLQSMNKLNTQLNTSKQVNRVSDDPFKTVKIMNIQNEINNVEKYNYNCTEVSGWIDITDGALESISTLMGETKILLKSISGAFGPNEVKAVQTEINEKVKQMGEAMNSTYAGKFIFGGSITDEPPIKIETDSKTGLSKLVIPNAIDAGGKANSKLDGRLKVEISDGITLDYNLTINTITKTSGNQDKDINGLDIINSITEKLNSDPVDMDEIGRLSIDLDNYINDTLNNRSLIGAKSNILQSVKENNDENILEMKGLFSQIQDVDVTEKFMKLKEAEMMYTASLQVGAKLLKPTILDYLR